MTLMLDQDSTQAADLTEDETQSLHAWSQADDADTVIAYTPGHSWKVPALLAALAAVAAVMAGAFLMWPHSATKPQVAPAKPQVAAPVHPTIAPSPPVQLQSPDQRFLSLVQQRGVKVVSPTAAIKGAHDVCRLESEGHNAREIAQAFVDVTPGADLQTEGVFVMTAEEIYCPQ